MARESAGAVVVTIDGDSSPLLAKYAQAEAQSRAAGQRIAAGLGQGLSSAAETVEQFGNSVNSGITVPMLAATPAVEATTAAVTGVGAAARHSVTEIQASSAALRTLEGGTQGSLRAAERFISIIPGVGAALQVAFPLIGLLAFGEILVRIIGKFTGLSEAEKDAEQENKRFSDSIAGLRSRLEELNLAEFADIYGRVAGEFNKASSIVTGAVGSDVRQIALLKASISDVQAHGLESQSVGQALKRGAIQELVPGGADINKSSAQAAQKAKLLELTQRLDEAEIKLAIDSKDGSNTARTALKDQAEEEKRAAEEAKRTAEEEARSAKEAANERMRAAREAAAEEKRQATEVTRVIREGHRIEAEDAKKSAEEAARSTLDGLRETARAFETEEAARLRLIQEGVSERNRSDQEKIKATGVSGQSTDEVAKLQLQGAYQLQIVHTRQQELQYAQDIGAADEKALSDKIATLQALHDYQAANLLVKEIDATDLEIEKAKAALLKQQIVDATKLAELRLSPLGKQISGIGERIPGQLGGALASGAVNGNIGRAVGGAAKNAGQEVISSVATAAIKQLIVKMGIQTAATTVLGAITGTHTAVVAANTVGTAVNTGAT